MNKKGFDINMVLFLEIEQGFEPRVFQSIENRIQYFIARDVSNDYIYGYPVYPDEPLDNLMRYGNNLRKSIIQTRKDSAYFIRDHATYLLKDELPVTINQDIASNRIEEAENTILSLKAKGKPSEVEEQKLVRLKKYLENLV